MLSFLLLTALLASSNAQVRAANVLRIEKRVGESGQVQVVILLDKAVPYRAEALHDPERVFVDLEGARPSLKSPAVIGDTGAELISKIVVGEHEPGTTRVVVHLRQTCKFSVMPERLVSGIAINLSPGTPESATAAPVPRKIAPIAPPSETPAAPTAAAAAPVRRRFAAQQPEAVFAAIRPPELPSSDMLIPMLMRADAGDASAEASIAYLHDIGRFGPTHYEQAAEWYARAASKGHVYAMARLGAMYENGLGVQEDPARARYWYSRVQDRTGISSIELKRLFGHAPANAKVNSPAPENNAASQLTPAQSAPVLAPNAVEAVRAPAGSKQPTVARTAPAAETIATEKQLAPVIPANGKSVPAKEPTKTESPVSNSPARAALEPHGNVLTVPLKPAASASSPTEAVPLPPLDAADFTGLPQRRAALEVPVAPPARTPPVTVARLPAVPVLAPVPPEKTVAVVPASASLPSTSTPRPPARSIEFDPALAPKDPKQAFDYFRRGALAGSSAAQFGLGSMYFEGRGVTTNAAEAVRWYQAAAKQGHARAQSNLGLMYLNGWGVEKSVRQAVAWFRKAADQGDAAGQSNLGAAYVSGTGVVPDYAEAAKWLQRAADQGIAEAQYGLATLYINGRGVQSNLPAAAEYLQRAAAQHYPKAQLVLGQMYLNGKVNDVNHDAIRLIEAAATSGMPDAQWTLGKMYQEGRGVSKSDVLALKWLQKAAELKSAEAQYAIGELYRDGRGVPKDPVMAYAWFAVSAANHHDGGLKEINSLSPTMTMAQLSAGQQQAYALMMQILQAGKGPAVAASAARR